MRPRAHERRSKDGQQTPKSAQELAKSASDSPKTGPGDAQTLPKTSPVSPTTRFWLDLRGLLVSKDSSGDFCNFGRSAQCLRSVFRPIKTVVLLQSEHWDSASAHTASNLQKERLVGRKTSLERPQTLKNRARSASGRPGLTGLAAQLATVGPM